MYTNPGNEGPFVSPPLVLWNRGYRNQTAYSFPTSVVGVGAPNAPVRMQTDVEQALQFSKGPDVEMPNSAPYWLWVR